MPLAPWNSVQKAHPVPPMWPIGMAIKLMSSGDHRAHSPLASLIRSTPKSIRTLLSIECQKIWWPA
jgi:hypothetical protein